MIIIKSFFGPLAQLVEQETLNLFVVGSTPTRPINKINRLLIICLKTQDKALFTDPIAAGIDILPQINGLR